MTSDPSLRGAAITGMRWSALQSVGSRVLSTVVFVVLARLLPTDAFGLVALASVFVALLTILVNQGFGDALVQRRTLDDEHLDTAFWAGLGLGAVLAAVLCAAAGPLAAVFDEPGLAPVLRALSVTFVLAGAASAPEALLRRDLRFRVLALRTLWANVAGSLIGLGLALAGAGVWALVGQAIGVAAVSSVVLWSAVRWRPGLRVRRAALRDLAGFSLSMLGIQLMTFASRRGDDLLIGLVLGTTALGYYTIAYRLLLLMSDVLVGTVQDVAFPTFARLRLSLPRLRQAHRTATRMCAVVAVPAFVGTASVAPEVLHTFFGPRWGPSAPVMVFLSVVGAQQALQYFNGTVMMALGRPGAVLRLVGVNTAVNLLFFAVVVHWGIEAVAASFALRALLLAPLSHRMARRALDLRPRAQLDLFAAPVAAATVMALVVTGLRLASPDGIAAPVRLAALTVTGAGVYLTLMWWWGRSFLVEVTGFLRFRVRALPQTSPGAQDDATTGTTGPDTGQATTGAAVPEDARGAGDRTWTS